MNSENPPAVAPGEIIYSASSADKNVPLKPRKIVGIGASAGGLESLERLFQSMPTETGMAFVVIQHLSPDFKSMMDELLARRTQIPIRQAEDQLVVEPDCIYLLPPKKEMIIADGRLLLTDKEKTKELTLPIDRFFRSLAQDVGERAIGIILSGTGTDGSRGITEIKKAGGLVICESETSAKFNGMPASAQKTGAVDWVLRPEEIPDALLNHGHIPASQEPSADNTLTPTLRGVEAIFDLLRTEFHIDFSHYKPTTVTRRIERRVSMHGAGDLESYVEQLRLDAAELRLLYADLLIGVTQFFRDRECFEELEYKVIPNLLSRTPPHEPLRVWVAGCATGEEAYSLAMLLHEQLESMKRPVEVKIFATDAHKSSLEIASAGVYDGAKLAEVSAARLRRYFVKKPDGFHVSHELRNMIVFAPHDVIKDAPFTKLNLISCRNLLIYLQPQVQKKALSLFHFGLKSGGVLFLGSSESPGELAEEFDTLNEHCKIYRKRRDIRLPAIDIEFTAAPAQMALQNAAAARPGTAGNVNKTLILETYDQLLDRFMPPSLLINEKRELLDSFGGAERFLRIKSRRPSTNVLELLNVDLKATVAGGLRRAEKERKAVHYSGVKLPSEGNGQAYRLSIEPLYSPRYRAAHFLISLQPLQEIEPTLAQHRPDVSDIAINQATHDQLDTLENELRYTKENLQATIEELETSNEELQATNEELVASNEELQSTNEELVASNEELQSTNEELNSVNEELYTVNSEYQKKIQELKELNEDMNHLLESTDIGTIFLDRNLCIRRFTPRIAAIFDLIDQDIGRRISSFSHRLDYEHLVDEIERVLRAEAPVEDEVRDLEGNIFFLRISPYRSETRVEGLVLTLTDISVLEETRIKLRRLSAIVESSDDAIISADLNGTVISWNAAAEQLYGYSAGEAIGKNLQQLIFPPSKHDELRDSLERVLRSESVYRPDTLRKCKDDKLLEVAVNAFPVRNAAGDVVGIAAITRDITGQKDAERQLRISEEKYQDLYHHAPDMYASIDAQTGLILECNETLLKQLGYARETIIGQPVLKLYAAESQAAVQTVFAELQETGAVHDAELKLVRQDGSILNVSLNVSALRDENGRIVRNRSMWRDITARKQAEEKLREAVRQREQFLAMLSHELRNPLNALQNATVLLNMEGIDANTAAMARHLIERQTAHMTRLLDDLLDVSRITQNKLELRREQTDLTRIVEYAVDTLRGLLEQRENQLLLDIPSTPLLVYGDPDRLQQVQANLLSNAAKYSAPGKRIWLTLGQDNDHAVISVRDEGAGIAKEMLERIFDLFVQMEQKADRTLGGMGVGLTLVRSIVAMHGGSVAAHSEGPGTGSEFIVRLPLLRDATQRSPDAQHNLPAPAALRILIVEDMEASRTSLQVLLELQGYQVMTAVDGAEGLAVARRELPDVALVDIGLPVMDGYELARRLRQEAACQGIYLVALTGYGQAADVERAREAGFDEHIVKPLDHDRLKKLFRRWE